MKKGKIVQVGSSQELYMHPNSLFVAHFIGESNFLEGYITKANGESEIELREGLKINALNQLDIKQGERVVLAIRPETCEMKKGHIVAENSLVGKVEKATFEGIVVRYEIRLNNGDRFVINRPSITYPLDKALLFPYPEAGLAEEIRV
jgi:spermidine/putrescine transport system ATP-binding protein